MKGNDCPFQTGERSVPTLKLHRTVGYSVYLRRESMERERDLLGGRLRDRDLESSDSLRPRLRDGSFLLLPRDESDEYEPELEDEVESESESEESESEPEDESLSDEDEDRLFEKEKVRWS